MRFCQNLIGLVLIVQDLDVSPKNGVQQLSVCCKTTFNELNPEK